MSSANGAKSANDAKIANGAKCECGAKCKNGVKSANGTKCANGAKRANNEIISKINKSSENQTEATAPTTTVRYARMKKTVSPNGRCSGWKIRYVWNW